jgi:hypothetical protein
VRALKPQLALGRSIAELRRSRGWSQPELAGMLGRPVAWLSQLERGLVQVGPISASGAVARVPLPAEPDSHPLADAERAEQAAALQLVLSGDWQRRRDRCGTLGAGSAAVSPATATEVWALTGARRYQDLARLLGDLVPELAAAVRAAPDHQLAGLYELMAVSYQACAAALTKLGEHDSALTAADRALTAAHRAGDPQVVAASAYMLVCILMETRRCAQARAIATAATDAMSGPAADGSVAAISLRGALTLLHALAAARAGDRAAAEELLSRARVMAGRLAHDRRSRGTGFGPDHVALYEIAVSIETGAPLLAAGAAPAGR